MSGTPVPASGEHTVVVEIGATAEQVPVLRTVTADLASRADFDLDTVEDLRLAVDEAAAQLVALARPDTRLTSRFLLTPALLAVTVSVGARSGTRVGADSFGWRVLSTLADDVTTTETDGPEGPTLAITLSKKHHDEMRSVDR